MKTTIEIHGTPNGWNVMHVKTSSRPFSRPVRNIVGAFNSGPLPRLALIEAAKVATAASLADEVVVEGNFDQLDSLRRAIDENASDDVSRAVRTAFLMAWESREKQEREFKL